MTAGHRLVVGPELHALTLVVAVELFPHRKPVEPTLAHGPKVVAGSIRLDDHNALELQFNRDFPDGIPMRNGELPLGAQLALQHGNITIAIGKAVHSHDGQRQDAYTGDGQGAVPGFVIGYFQLQFY